MGSFNHFMSEIRNDLRAYKEHLTWQHLPDNDSNIKDRSEESPKDEKKHDKRKRHLAP